MESPLLSGTNKTSFRDLRDSPYWNIFLLAIAWSLTLTTSTLLTTIGPLSAVYLGATDTLAAFTIGVFLIGAAVSSVPSGWLFRSYGRYLGFTAGCICQIIGSGLGIVAMATGSLFSLYISCLFIGLGQGIECYSYSCWKSHSIHIHYTLSLLCYCMGHNLSPFFFKIHYFMHYLSRCFEKKWDSNYDPHNIYKYTSTSTFIHI